MPRKGRKESLPKFDLNFLKKKNHNKNIIKNTFSDLSSESSNNSNKSRLSLKLNTSSKSPQKLLNSLKKSKIVSNHSKSSDNSSQSSVASFLSYISQSSSVKKAATYIKETNKGFFIYKFIAKGDVNGQYYRGQRSSKPVKRLS